MMSASSALRFSIFTILATICAGLGGFAQNQFAEEKLLLESDFTRPDELVAADFNNDGYEDLLVYSPFDDIMSWIPNYGGEFGEPIFIQNNVFHYPYRKSFAVADLNSDGTQDIIFITKDNEALAWCSNWTDGIFGPPQIIDSENLGEINQIEIHHLDDFSHPVIYAIDNFNAARYTFNNELDGNREVLASINSTWGTFAIADLFNDSTPEIISRTDYPYDSFQISYVNPEDPSEYLTNTTSTQDGLRIYGIETADINGDGHTDILLYCRGVNSDNRLLIAENNGLGGFDQRINNGQIVTISSAKLADVDLDGDLDIVDGVASIYETGSEVLNWLENDGNGNFTNFQNWNENSVSFNSGYDWVATDVENDGVDEIIFCWENQNALKQFKKDEYYQFEKELTYSVVKPRVFEVTDFDGNGLQDILFVSQNSQGVEVMLQTSAGAFLEPLPICTNIKNIVGIYPYEGHPSKYWVRTREGFYIVNLGSMGTFECSDRVLHETDGVYVLGFGDLNGDGFQDLSYYRGREDNILRTFMNHNDVILEEASSMAANAAGLYSWYPPLYAHIDTNNDGANEIAIVDLEVAQIHIRERKNNGQFALQQSIDLPSSFNTGRVFARDLNNDGYQDMVFITEYNSDVFVGGPTQRSYWFMNQGGGSFSEASFIQNVDPNILIWYIIDIDGDSDLDFITKRAGDLTFGWCENDGQGNFDFVGLIDGPRVSSLRNFNFDVQGEGIVDYFASVSGGHGRLEYSNSCEGVSLEVKSVSSSLNYYGDAGDLDGDGDLDLVSSYEKISWNENVPELPLADFEILGPCGTYCFENNSAANYNNSTIHWDFGDGETSSDIFPEKSIFELGTYTVTLTICNSNGCDTQTKELNVEHQVSFEIPESVAVNTPVQFQDVSTGFTNFTWVFGDGEVSTERNPIHTYLETGAYTVEVYVTDNEELDCTHFYSRQIQVLNDKQLSDEENLVITPNPSSTLSIAELSPFGDLTEVSIFNMQGLRIFHVETTKTILELNASEYAPGVYYVVVEGSNQTFARSKWIVL